MFGEKKSKKALLSVFNEIARKKLEKLWNIFEYYRPLDVSFGSVFKNQMTHRGFCRGTHRGVWVLK